MAPDLEPNEALQTDEALSRAEVAATEAENSLRSEIARLQQQAATVQTQFSALQEAVSKGYGGDGDAAFMALLRRCQTTPTPSLQLAAHWDRARTARKAAIDARQKERTGIERALQQYREQLQKLAEQVANDDRHLRELQTARAAQAAPTPAAAPPVAKKGAPPLARKGPPPAAAPKPAAPPAAAPAPVPATAAPAVTPAASAPAPTAAAAAAAAAPEPKGAERRQQTRVRLESAISFESEDNFYTGFSVDISEGGIFISTVNLLPVGTPVDLTLKLPDGFSADVHGVVRWLRDWNELTPQVPAGIGIQFVDMPPTTTTHLQKFVTQRDAMFYDGDEV